MDILSNVDVAGTLSTRSLRVSYDSNFLRNSYFSGYASFSGNFEFSGSIELYGCTEGNCTSFSTTIGHNISVDIPANCQRFLITSFNMLDLCSQYTDDTLTDDQLFFPSVTAWCGRKKVEVDLEICVSSMNLVGMNHDFTEFLLANVTPSSSSRKIRFALSYL